MIRRILVSKGLFFGALALAGTAAFTGCRRAEPDSTSRSDSVIPVRTAQVEPVSGGRLLEIPGTVRARQYADLAPRIMGKVEERPTPIGQFVTSGEVLLRIEAAEIGARLNQAEARLAQVRRDYERESGLQRQGASTLETVRALGHQLAVAEAAAEEARTFLAYTEIRAPFDGTITARLVEAGDLVTPGMKVFEIEGAGSRQVLAHVPESAVRALQLGTRLTVTSDGVSAPVFAEIAEMSPAADPQTRTVLIKADLPEGTPLRSGHFVRIAIPAGESHALEVPIESITRFGQMERVFAVESGRGVLRLVRTGAVRGNRVEIIAGLSAGETVVLNPPPELRDGGAVVPAP